MSTSENGSQLAPSLPDSNLVQEKEFNAEKLSSNENILQNGEHVSNTSDVAASPPHSPVPSQNGSNLTLQSEDLPPDSSFQSNDLNEFSQVTLDTAPEIHPTETVPSSELHSQDSQYQPNLEENGKEPQEEYLDPFEPEPSSSLNPLDESITQNRENSEIDVSSDHSSEFDLDYPNLRFPPHSYDQLSYANYILSPQDQLRICLDKNLQYQAWIKHQLQLIEYVEMKLKEDQDRLQTLAKNATKGTRAQAKNMVTLRKFFPYFRDQNGLPPPVDKLAIKNEAHLCGLYDKPASKWTEKERQDLAKGVRMQNLEALCRPMLLALENASDPRARELRREIELIKRKPDHELELNLDGIEWDKLAIDMTPNRHPVECKLQWIQIDHPLVSRKSWNKQEDKSLLKLAKENSERDWNTIAMRLKSNRTPVQCLQRYQTALNTEHVKREWSRDDDEKLREAVAKCGVGNWQEVANFMGNSHTGAQCLNRWDKTIKPTFRKGKWTEEEDDLLKKGVDFFGIGNWKKIASIVTSRTDVQCRERWVNILDPTIDHAKWNYSTDIINCDILKKPKALILLTHYQFLLTSSDNKLMKSSILNDSDFKPQCVSSPVANGDTCLTCLIPPDISNLSASREIIFEDSAMPQCINESAKSVDAKFLEDFICFSQDYIRPSASNISNPPATALARKLSFNDSQTVINRLLKLSNWSLPPSVVDVYEERGIECMFRWQVECLMKRDVLLGRNLVYSAPTSSGKTLVAEMLMIKRIIETKKKGIYVLPYISIVNEKVHQLRRLLEECGLSVGGFMGVSAPRGGFSSVDIAVCTIEKANSMVNRLIEDRTLSEQVSIVVVDEIHMVSDPHRGYLLELLLTKISYLTGPATSSQSTAAYGFSLQIVGMSATLPNLRTLSEWLTAEFYSADFRPVELKEMIKCKNVLYDGQLSQIRSLPTKPEASELEHIKHLCSETVDAGHSVLVFCPKRDWCESVSRELSDSKLYTADEKRVASVCQMLYESCKKPDRLLIRCLPNGVGFHHAGLTLQEREIVEGSFSDGTLRILTATSTLSSGVNLPARRVIIRSITQANRKELEPVTYRQMCGRAGRTGLDDYGESILVCSQEEKERARVLLNSTLKPVQSSLNTDNTDGMFQYYGVKRALLEVVTCGVVRLESDARVYMNHTLLAADLRDPVQLDSIVCVCFEFLIDNEFIEYTSKSIDREVTPTQLGAATLASSLPPDEALFVLDEIKRARRCFVLENELHMVYQVTPICLQELWSEGEPKWREYMDMVGKLPPDMKRVADLVGIEEGYITSCISGRAKTRTQQERKFLAIYRRFRAALALHELVNEHPLHEVARKFELPKGQLQSLQIQAGTFAGMVTTFCRKLTWKNLDMLLSQFQTRLEFGVQQELTELVRIPLLNGHRARALYDKGFHNLALIADGEVEVVSKILRDAHPFQQKNTDNGHPRKNWVSQLRKGLTEREIACEIIEEAGRILGQNMAFSNYHPSPPIRSQPLSSVITPINELLRHSQTENKFLTRRHTDGSPGSISNRIKSHPISLLQITQALDSPSKRIKLQSRNRDIDFSAQYQFEDPLLQDSNPSSPNLLATASSDSNPSTLPISDITYSGTNERTASTTHDPSLICSNSSNNSSVNSRMKLYKNSQGASLEILDSEYGTTYSKDLESLDGLLSPFDSPPSLLQVSKDEFNSQDSPDIPMNSILPITSPSCIDSSPALLQSSTGLSQCIEEEFVLNYSPLVSPGNSPSPQPANETHDLIGEPFCLSIFNDTTLSLKADPNKFERIEMSDLDTPLTVEEWFTARREGSQSVTFSEFECPVSLSMSSLIKRVVSPGSEQFRELQERCTSSHVFSFSFAVTPTPFSDKITSSPSNTNQLLGTALYFGGNEVFYIEQSPPLPMSQSAPHLSILSLAKPTSCIVAWDIKSQLVHLLRCDVRVSALLADPQIAYWLLNPDSQPKSLSSPLSELRTYQKGGQQSWLSRIEPVSRGPVSTACTHSIAALLLMKELEKKMRRENVFEVFLFNEMLAVSNFAVLEVNGIGIDIAKLGQESVKNQQKLKELSQQALDLTDFRTDLSKESDVAKLLFTHLNLPIISSPKPAHKSPATVSRRKHPCTSRNVLEEIKTKHPVVKVVIAHRKEEYALNHCLRPLNKARVLHHLLNAYRVHPKSNFHTVTGRVILENPDLQHTPKDFELPDLLTDSTRVSMRSLFPARPGCVLISADFSQIELRMLAQFCKDPALMEIFSSKGDIFKLIASSFHHIPVSDVSTQQRYDTKQICYGILYGMGNETLAHKMKIPLIEADMLISNFKDRFKGIDPFVEKVVSNCKRNGCVESLLGRKRQINWREAGRIALNTKIQSSASDLVKMGLNNTFRELAHQNIRTNLYPLCNSTGSVLFCHFLHDELIFEVSQPLLYKAASVIKYSLQNALKLDLPFPVVIKSGQSWGDLETLDV